MNQAALAFIGFVVGWVSALIYIKRRESWPVVWAEYLIHLSDNPFLPQAVKESVEENKENYQEFYEFVRKR